MHKNGACGRWMINNQQAQEVFDLFMERPPPQHGCEAYLAFWKGYFERANCRWPKDSIGYAAWLAGRMTRQQFDEASSRT